MKYIAYNTNTGEVITTRFLLSLLCKTWKTSRFDKKHFGIKAHWVYARPKYLKQKGGE